MNFKIAKNSLFYDNNTSMMIFSRKKTDDVQFSVETKSFTHLNCAKNGIKDLTAIIFYRHNSRLKLWN